MKILLTLRKKPTPVTIASFDIGIKNLAFCILSYDSSRLDGSRFQIQDWQDLNLIPNNETKYCQQLIHSGTRKGQPCEHRAYSLTTTEIPLCKRHVTTFLKTADDQESDDQESDDQEEDGEHDDEVGADGENLVESKSETTVIRYRQIANMTTQEINEELVKTLDRFPDLLKCQTIVLEHQPSKNPRMKNLSNVLYSYFVIRGIVDRPGGPLQKILFISPRNKLSIYDGPDIPCHLKGSYARNKFYGKKYC